MALRTKKLIKRLNRKGGIEGLPLELMIIVVVATLGTAMVVGWMGNIEEPNSIGEVTCSVKSITMTEDTCRTGLNFYITDSHGNPVKDATIYLSGCSVSMYESKVVSPVYTTSTGMLSIMGVYLTKTTPGVGYIDVTVVSPTLGEDSSLRIPVIR